MTDETANEALIQRFQYPIFNLVSRLMDDPSDAAEVTQKVFRKLFRNVGRYECQGALKISIYRIAVKEAHNHRNWFRRCRRLNVGPKCEALIEEALCTLTPTLRAALVLREVENLSDEEISEILGVSLNTVKLRVQRARDAFRNYMAGSRNAASAPEWTVKLTDR